LQPRKLRSARQPNVRRGETGPAFISSEAGIAPRRGRGVVLGLFVQARDFASAGGALAATTQPGVGKTLLDGTK